MIMMMDLRQATEPHLQRHVALEVHGAALTTITTMATATMMSGLTALQGIMMIITMHRSPVDRVVT